VTWKPLIELSPWCSRVAPRPVIGMGQSPRLPSLHVLKVWNSFFEVGLVVLPTAGSALSVPPTMLTHDKPRTRLLYSLSRAFSELSIDDKAAVVSVPLYIASYSPFSWRVVASSDAASLSSRAGKA
jgi:hypothetical protein